MMAKTYRDIGVNTDCSLIFTMAKESGIMPIGQVILRKIEEILEKNKQQIAVVYEELPEHPKVPFDHIYHCTLSLLHFLKREGFSTDKSVIGICLENSHNFLIAFAAVTAGRTIAALFDPESSSTDLLNQLNNSNAQTLITTAEVYLQLLEQSRYWANLKNVILVNRFGKPLDIKGFNVYTWTQVVAHKPKFHFHQRAVVPTTPALLIYPEKPRRSHDGILISHSALLIKEQTMADFVARCLATNTPKNRKTSVEIITVPPHLLEGVVHFLNAILAEQTLIVCEDKASVICDAVTKYNVNYLTITINAALEITKYPIPPLSDLSSVKVLGITSHCVGKKVAEELMNKFNGAQHFVQTMRIPEVLNYCSLSQGVDGLGSCGRIFDDVECKIIDVETGRKLPTTQIGELWVKSPTFMIEYWKDPQAKANVITHDGWYLTGKLAKLDADYNLHYICESNEVIFVDSRPVYPTLLEEKILEHPKVADCAIVGVSHKKLGKVPRAFVVKLSLDLTEEEIYDHIKQKGKPEEELLGGMYFVSKIPRNASGGVDKQLLVKLFVLRK